MAKVKVRALQPGFDGTIRRNPGDEFDFDIERFGQGRWFELVAEKESIASRSASPVAKKKSTRRKKRKSSDLLA